MYSGQEPPNDTTPENDFERVEKIREIFEDAKKDKSRIGSYIDEINKIMTKLDYTNATDFGKNPAAFRKYANLLTDIHDNMNELRSLSEDNIDDDFIESIFKDIMSLIQSDPDDIAKINFSVKEKPKYKKDVSFLSGFNSGFKSMMGLDNKVIAEKPPPPETQSSQQLPPPPERRSSQQLPPPPERRSSQQLPPPPERRSFLSRIKTPKVGNIGGKRRRSHKNKTRRRKRKTRSRSHKK